MKHLKVIAFDADDTLWHSEHMFHDVQQRLSEILDHYAPHDQVQTRLHETEVNNIKLFGYGVKGFTLSMIETAIEISRGRISAPDIHDIVMLGKGMLDAPLDLIDGCAQVLEELKADYRLFLITKGDVLDQRNKIEKSGLEALFERTEVVQEKDPEVYRALFKEHDIDPRSLAMVGNSMRSDILPILELDGTGIYIPYHVTAHFEIIEEDISHPRFHQLGDISELPEFLAEQRSAGAEGR